MTPEEHAQLMRDATALAVRIGVVLDRQHGQVVVAAFAIILDFLDKDRSDDERAFTLEMIRSIREDVRNSHPTPTTAPPTPQKH